MRTGQLLMAYILYIWLHFSDFYRLWPHAVISASCYLIKHSAEGLSSSSLVCVCTSALALAPAMQSHAVSAWCSVWGVLAHFSSYKKANTSALCEPAKIKLLTIKRLHQITERIFWRAMCLCNSPECFFFFFFLRWPLIKIRFLLLLTRLYIVFLGLKTCRHAQKPVYRWKSQKYGVLQFYP